MIGPASPAGAATGDPVDLAIPKRQKAFQRKSGGRADDSSRKHLDVRYFGPYSLGGHWMSETAIPANCGTIRDPPEHGEPVETPDGRGDVVAFHREGESARCVPGDPDQGTAREDRTTDGGTRFFSTRLRSMSRDRRKSVVETNHPRLGVVRQCRLLGLCRSTFYYKTAGETP